MARPVYRIREVTQPRVYRGQVYDPGAFQVERRTALVCWGEIAVCATLLEAAAAMCRDARERREARIKPRVLGVFDRDGKELTT
ncbi:hypothetical protein [Burkholderia ubonensis]|uniref:hypothetical protein n=1 Tax=Burkholderia ubonensis TaxID=101571 RepID=UPI0007537C0B|nr:hypothetical protein [Burkholderia ubonensis]KVC61862.1 hypothetical protein WI72_11640 [Burkholderia ubonensis]KVU21720.1 hypothetical protein WK64_31585 [Burkholderia ubonensis]